MDAIKKLNLSVMLLIALLFSMIGSHLVAADDSAGASASPFSDVKSHWAKATITWALEKKIVKGYPDGTFRPDSNVSEAEFLTMFVTAFGLNWQSSELKWPKPIYTYAIQMNFPIKGTTDISLRSAKINRLQVAEIITGANGVHYSGNDAIQYILGNKLSNGKKSATIAGYAGSDNLTRAEAIQFIKNLLDQGMTKLLPRPTEVSESSLLPALPPAPMDTSNLPDSIAKVYTKLQLIIQNYPGFNVTAAEDHIGIAKDGNTFDSLSFTPAKVKNQVSITHLYTDGTDTTIKLAVELLKAQGFTLKDDFAQTIKNAMSTSEKITVKAGDIEILIAPSPDLKDNVDFWYIAN